MPIDTSKMDPAEAAQAQMFESLLDTLPDEGLILLQSIIGAKIDERRGG
jgi:hypothetical protein